MKGTEFYAYHIVTNKEMTIGQIINFDRNQKIPYIASFLKEKSLILETKTLSKFYPVISQRWTALGERGC